MKSLFNKQQLRYIRMLQQCDINTYQKDFLKQVIDGYKIEVSDLESEYLQLMFSKYEKQIQQKIKISELIKHL